MMNYAEINLENKTRKSVISLKESHKLEMKI